MKDSFDCTKLCFSNIKKFRKNCKHLIHGAELLKKNNVIHSDIKLDNIVCNSKGELRIIDFGGSINLNKENSHNKLCNKLYYNMNRNYKKLIYSGGITYGYIPPEIIVLEYI